MHIEDDPEYKEIEARIDALRDEISELEAQKKATPDHNEKDRIEGEINNLEGLIPYQLKLLSRMEEAWEREQEED